MWNNNFLILLLYCISSGGQNAFGNACVDMYFLGGLRSCVRQSGGAFLRSSGRRVGRGYAYTYALRIYVPLVRDNGAYA